MTVSANTNEGLITLLNSYLKRNDDIDWLDWLPLADVAAETPERWVEVFNQLPEEKQYDFIELLRDDRAGSLADGLLVVLAAGALEITDEQVRQFVLDDAKDAYSRNVSRIQKIQESLETRSRQLDGAKERLKQGFDLTIEITKREHQLAEIRAEENQQDEKFAQVHALERDILRLETRKRILANYDRSARTGFLNEMKEEIISLDLEKATLEQAIADATGKLDTLKRDVAHIEKEKKGLEEEIESFKRRGEEAREGLAHLREVFGNLRKEEESFKAEQMGLVQSVEQLEKRNREAKVRVDESRKKFVDLEKEAKGSGLLELERKIREVYSLLPEDNADRVCH